MKQSLIARFNRYRAPLLVLAGSVMSGAAGAQATTGAISIGGAETTVNAIVGVGVTITTALTLYKLGKRGANRA